MSSPFAQSRVALHQLAQRLMRHGFILLSMAMMVGNAAAEPSADATEWATAISKHAKDGRVIVFRYASTAPHAVAMALGRLSNATP